MHCKQNWVFAKKINTRGIRQLFEINVNSTSRWIEEPKVLWSFFFQDSSLKFSCGSPTIERVFGSVLWQMK